MTDTHDDHIRSLPGLEVPLRLCRSLAAPSYGWTTTADVVVVGSGIAGLTAALKLRRRVNKVMVVTKTQLSSGSTLWAQGGIAAALADTDTPHAHLVDTLIAGAGLCDVDAVDVLVTEGPERVRELIGLGAKFDTGDDGKISLTREGGHHADRIVHAGGDATGAEISRALVDALEAVRNDPGIEVIEHAMVIDLLTGVPDNDGASHVAGVSLHMIGEGTRDGVGAVLAPTVLMATGGVGQVFISSTNPREATGDGTAAALRAGAEIADLEFVQFHPTVLWLGTGAKGQQPLISEAVRGEGAWLVDSNGKRFMPEIHEMAELAPRDVVSRAIMRQMIETDTDHVYLDARHLGRKFLNERFPTIAQRLATHGFDLAQEPVPVAPAQHYHSGGIVVDLNGRSTLSGLYAIGETSCTGVHGANRLASNSLLEGLVFANRAVDDITRRLDKGELQHIDPMKRAGDEALLPGEMRVLIQRNTSSGPGVVRDEAHMAKSAKVLAGVQHLNADDLEKGESPIIPSSPEWETTNLHQIASALTYAARLRAESRGGHDRVDCPNPDDDWLCRIHVWLDDEGVLQTRTVALSDNSIQSYRDALKERAEHD